MTWRMVTALEVTGHQETPSSLAIAGIESAERVGPICKRDAVDAVGRAVAHLAVDHDGAAPFLLRLEEETRGVDRLG